MLLKLPSPPPTGYVVMFVYINCVVYQRDIKGYIAMLTDSSSLTTLEGLLTKYIQRITGEPVRNVRA